MSSNGRWSKTLADWAERIEVCCSSETPGLNLTINLSGAWIWEGESSVFAKASSDNPYVAKIIVLIIIGNTVLLTPIKFCKTMFFN